MQKLNIVHFAERSFNRLFFFFDLGRGNYTCFYATINKVIFKKGWENHEDERNEGES